jgi:hypothetical protein
MMILAIVRRSAQSRHTEMNSQTMNRTSFGMGTEQTRRRTHYIRMCEETRVCELFIDNCGLIVLQHLRYIACGVAMSNVLHS